MRALVNHMVAENLWVPELLAGKTIAEVGDRFDGDVLGQNPVAAHKASAKAAIDAVNAPGALEAACAVSYGPVPGEVYIGHRFLDVLIHGWDLAKVTGQDTRLDPELTQACWDIVQPQTDMLRESGVFGPVVKVPPTADLQTRLLALLGRRA